MTKESEIEQRDVAQSGRPDLGLGPEYNKNWRGGLNTCDFTIYHDAKRMWHAVACVRVTNAPGERVFHAWTSDSLTAENWPPQDVLDRPRATRLGNPSSVQALHAFRHEGKYHCYFYFV